MTNATHVRCKTCCCAVAKPSAVACDFLAIHTQALTTDDRRCNSKHSRTYYSFKERLKIHTAPVLTYKHDTDGKRHLPPLQTLLLHCRQSLHKRGKKLRTYFEELVYRHTFNDFFKTCTKRRLSLSSFQWYPISNRTQKYFDLT